MTERPEPHLQHIRDDTRRQHRMPSRGEALVAALGQRDELEAQVRELQEALRATQELYEETARRLAEVSANEETCPVCGDSLNAGGFCLNDGCARAHEQSALVPANEETADA